MSESEVTAEKTVIAAVAYVWTTRARATTAQQTAACRRLAAERATPIRAIYADRGVGAGARKRPGLDRLLDALAADPVRAVYIAHPDGAVRDDAYPRELRKTFKRRGIEVIDYGLDDITAAAGL